MTADNVIAKYANDLILDMYQCAKLGIFKGYINWFAASYQHAVEERKRMEWVIVKKHISIGPTTAMIPGIIGYIPMGTRMSSVGDSHFVKMAIPTNLTEKPDLTAVRIAFAHSYRKVGYDLSATVDRLVGKKPRTDSHRKVNGVPLDWKTDVPTEQLKELRTKVTVLVEHKDENGHVDGMLIIPNGADLVWQEPENPSPLTVKCHPDGTTEYGYDPTKGTPEQAGDDLVKRYTDVFGTHATTDWILPDSPTGTISATMYDLSTEYAIKGTKHNEVR